MDVNRAIRQGIDSARHFNKDGESPYHLRHPLFPYWWEGVVLKADCRDFSESRIMEEARKRAKRKN